MNDGGLTYSEITFRDICHSFLNINAIKPDIRPIKNQIQPRYVYGLVLISLCLLAAVIV